MPETLPRLQWGAWVPVSIVNNWLEFDADRVIDCGILGNNLTCPVNGMILLSIDHGDTLKSISGISLNDS